MLQKPNRRSIRLKGYDYSQEGLYFVTLCCQDRICRFGKVVNGEMVLNEAGKVAENCWLQISEHFPNVALHEFVIMPNHVHGIIEITVGANQHLPTNDITDNRAKDFLSSDNNFPKTQNRAKDVSPQRPKGTSQTIGSIIRGFKIGVTKWVRENTDIYNLWQRNYYEHIIRSEKSYHNISNYIQNNPLNWTEDKFYG